MNWLNGSRQRIGRRQGTDEEEGINAQLVMQAFGTG